MLYRCIALLALITLVGCGQDKGLAFQQKGQRMLHDTHQSPLW